MEEQQQITFTDIDRNVGLILLGFLGIAVLMWFIITDSSKVGVVSGLGLEPEVVSNEEMNPGNFVDVLDRDKDVLGVATHKDVGRYFTQAQTGMTLYVHKDNNCDFSCMTIWTPYLASNQTESGLLTTEIIEGIGLQYVWSGKRLYLFPGDDFPGSIKGHGLQEGWEVARP